MSAGGVRHRGPAGPSESPHRMRPHGYAGYAFVAAAAALWGSLSVVVSEVGNAD